jgi:two-component system sensor histidine kinase YesM
MKVLIFFIPIIVLSVILTGVFSYLAAVNQLRKNAYSLLNDTLLQTNVILNNEFINVLDQLETITGSDAFKNLMTEKVHPDQKTTDAHYYDVIAIHNLFNDIYNRNFQVIDSIYMNLNNGREFSLMPNMVPQKIGVDLNAWMRDYSDTSDRYYWKNDHIDHVFDTVDHRDVMSSFKIIGNKNSPVNGLLIMNLKTDYFVNQIQNVKISPHGLLALVSTDKAIFSKKVKENNDIGTDGLNFLRRNSGNNGIFNIKSKNGEKLFVVFNTISANHWVLAAIVPESDIMAKASQIKYISLAIIILLLFISSVTATWFANNISNPIRFLSRQVERFEQGDINVDFTIQEKNEIGVLARGLSRLRESVTTLLRQLKEEQEKKRQMELLALQSQITPHFLYNTLGSIKHLIDMNDNGRASQMVRALIKFYMIGISKGKEMITVREELEHVKNYLLIQKMRYNKDFDFYFQIDDQILDCFIVKLTLQPLVENSIYHGIKSIRGRGTIRISGWKEENSVLLEVYDDGPGIPKETLQNLVKSVYQQEVDQNPITFGLRNVHQRLALHFGKFYGIQIESKEHHYTKMTIRIPFSAKEEGA